MRRILAMIIFLCTFVMLVEPASAYAPWHTETTHEYHWQRAMFGLLNDERQTHGLAPLHWSRTLHRSARHHDYEMAYFNTMSHQLPGELSLGLRITLAGYFPWCRVGENIGWTSDISRAGLLHLERLMYREQPPYNEHRLNILGHYRHVGIDAWIDRSHNKLWFTQDFGKHYNC